jgi:hypothetical protein
MVLQIGGKPIGLSMPHVLLIAMRDHARAHDRKKPKRFELHPELIAKLLMDRGSANSCGMCPLTGGWAFCGVPLVGDVLAARPKMITCTDEVEYL